MQSGCFLACEQCSKKTIYIKKTENICFFCKKPIVLDTEIEDAVIALNNLGVETYYSCRGHNDGFDESRRSYPCIACREEKVDLIKEILEDYNQLYLGKKERGFRLEIHQSTFGKPMWLIVPLYKEKSVEKLQRDFRLLAKHIFLEF